MGLEGKICLVTGAARGIGRATAIEMTRQGAAVVLTDVDADGLEESVTLVRDSGGEAAAFACDLTDDAAVGELVESAAAAFGGLDVLHNNAGVSESMIHGASTIETLPVEIFDRVMAINLRAVWFAIKTAAPYLRRSERGPAIVNAASVGGLYGIANSTAYCASKAAVINLTRVAAVDLAADGIRCNCYCPGAVSTPMLDDYVTAAAGDVSALSSLTAAQLIDRPGDPGEIAKLVCFLASDDSSFINGAIVPIDGGKTAWRGVRDSPPS